MKTKHISKNIEKLGPWYQRVNLDGIWTTEDELTGEHIWPFIRECLPDDLDGMTALDIGANACYYSFMLALEGVHVTSIEPSSMYYKQALFLKKYFEEKYNKELPVTILKKNISEIDILGYENVDFVLALSVLYFIGTQFGKKYSEAALNEMKRVIKELTQITDKIIVRTRNKVHYSSVAYYNSVFLENEFYMLKKIDMKRPITVYGRLIKDGDYGW